MKTIQILSITAALAIWSINAHANQASSQGTWQTTLLGRDANGQSVPASDANAIFLYDTSLNITWLKNANLNGQMTWTNAKSWADTLQVGQFSNWRLTKTPIPDDSCLAANSYPAVYSQGYGIGCTGSEMGHLFNTTLGNTPNTAISNAGNFQGLQNYYYWSGTPKIDDPYYVWTYNTAINGQAYTGTGTNPFFAMAVRDGDVLLVPEPRTFTLMLFALAVGAVVRRRSIPWSRSGSRADA